MTRYTVYVIPEIWKDIKTLPGNVRQRIRRAVNRLSENPRPSKSKKLRIPEADYELRRLRLDRWRIVYAITEAEKVVDVLAVRKRPPYDYGDLAEILEEM